MRACRSAACVTEVQDSRQAARAHRLLHLLQLESERCSVFIVFKQLHLGDEALCVAGQR